MLYLILTAVLLHLDADFRQIKETQLMTSEQVSNGHLTYTAPDCLRWEYTSPEAFVWEISGNQSDANPQVQRLLQLIMTTIAGNYLNDNAVFEVAKNGNEYTLTPKKREMKQLFQTIILTLNPQTTIAEKVVLTEKNGDKSTIFFYPTNVQFQDEAR